MSKTYTLKGFPNYIIIDGIMYRKPLRCRDKRYKYRYLPQRAIKRTTKHNKEGYWLPVKGNYTFLDLNYLRKKLQKQDSPVKAKKSPIFSANLS